MAPAPLAVALYRRLLKAALRGGTVPLLHPCPSIRTGANRWGTFSYWPANHAEPEICYERLMPAVADGDMPAVAVPSEAAWPRASRGYGANDADDDDTAALPSAPSAFSPGELAAVIRESFRTSADESDPDTVAMLEDSCFYATRLLGYLRKLGAPGKGGRPTMRSSATTPEGVRVEVSCGFEGAIVAGGADPSAAGGAGAVSATGLAFSYRVRFFHAGGGEGDGPDGGTRTLRLLGRCIVATDTATGAVITHVPAGSVGVVGQHPVLTPGGPMFEYLSGLVIDTDVDPRDVAVDMRFQFADAGGGGGKEGGAEFPLDQVDLGEQYGLRSDLDEDDDVDGAGGGGEDGDDADEEGGGGDDDDDGDRVLFRGRSLAGAGAAHRVGPPPQPRFTKWDTEAALPPFALDSDVNALEGFEIFRGEPLEEGRHYGWYCPGL